MSEKYSVLQTVYKSDNPEYLRLSLESMISQSVKPDELVLVKDGPITNELQAVIDETDKKYPGIIVQHQLDKNVGLGKALNEGIVICKNELIARMDSDDISLPERCEKQIALFKSDSDLDIVGCQAEEFCGNIDNVVGNRKVPLDNSEIHKFARRRDPFNHPTVMYRKSKVLKFGPYGDYRKNQDTDLWVKLLSSGCKGANLPGRLFLFRFDEGTYRKRKSWVNTKTLIKIRWNAYKIRFCSLTDFIVVTLSQLFIYIMPSRFQRILYTKVLRR